MNEKVNPCTACSACLHICPQRCISMKTDEWGFLYPVIQKEKCIGCGKCKKVCPNKEILPKVDELKEVNSELQKKAYYGFHKNSAIRGQSSSGGAFTALAEQILSEKGIVYGAAYDREKRKVYYTSTEKTSLSRLRKSKYVQSEMGNILKKIKRDLDTNRKVLFVGTPCHVAGVSQYFMEHPNKDHLLLCDFICHGVPSNTLLNQHIKLLGKKYHSRCKDVDFRPKSDAKHPWYKHHLKVTFSNGAIYDRSLDEDGYMACFMKENLFLRESCYDCRYCNGNRKADITLADFWGVTEYDSSLNDEKGLSLVITHTLQGERYLEKIQEKMNLYPLEWRYAAYAFKPRNAKKYDLAKREKALKIYQKSGYEIMLKHFMRKSIIQNKIKRLRDLIYKVLSRMKKMINKQPYQTEKKIYREESN